MTTAPLLAQITPANRHIEVSCRAGYQGGATQSCAPVLLAHLQPGPGRTTVASPSDQATTPAPYKRSDRGDGDHRKAMHRYSAHAGLSVWQQGSWANNHSNNVGEFGRIAQFRDRSATVGIWQASPEFSFEPSLAASRMLFSTPASVHARVC